LPVRAVFSSCQLLQLSQPWQCLHFSKVASHYVNTINRNRLE
jgi:hypothetical protein